MTTSFRLILSLTTVFLSLIMLVGCAAEPEPEPVPVFVEQAVVEPVYHMHTVRYSGETLGIISLWYTKKTANWKDIQDVNPGLDVRRMSIGTEIRIPDHMVERSEPLTKDFVQRVTGNMSKPDPQTVKSSAETQVKAAQVEQSVQVKETDLKELEAEEDPTAVRAEEEDAFLEDLLAEETDPNVAAGSNGQPEEQGNAEVPSGGSAVEQQDAEKPSGDSSDLSQDEIDRAELLEELLE